MTAGRSLAALPSPELAAPRRVLAVPLGSCEQHGPHLPIGTDTIIATALAERLAELAVPGEMRPLAEVAPDLHRLGVRSVSPAGVLGNPADATLEEGRDLLDNLTDDLVTAVDDARNTW